MAFDIIQLCCLSREANMFHRFAWTYSGNRDWYRDFVYKGQESTRLGEVRSVVMSGPMCCFVGRFRMSGSWSIKSCALSPVFKCNTVRSR